MVLRVLLVEDDRFSRWRSRTGARRGGECPAPVQLKIAGTGDEALAALEGVESHPVLLDYKLPGGDADTLLPGIRKGGSARCHRGARAAEREAPMQRCWLDLGADSYRVKPVPAGTVAELFTYALQKKIHAQAAPRERRRGATPTTRPRRGRGRAAGLPAASWRRRRRPASSRSSRRGAAARSTSPSARTSRHRLR